MEMVLFHIGILVAQHMDLLGIDAVGLKFGLEGFKVIKVVTDVVMPIHHTPPDSCSKWSAVSRN
ncbi:hypothetical protein D3C85_1762730 [compost metagenome]